jgi:hypothetical protein
MGRLLTLASHIRLTLLAYFTGTNRRHDVRPNDIQHYDTEQNGL